jgi:uncharacterized protein (TIGR02246 family)
MPNTDTQSRTALIRAMFAAVDARDAEGVAEYLTDDVVWALGSFDPTEGKETFVANVKASTQRIKGIRHEIHDLWHATEDPDVVIARMTVHYTKLDGSSVSLPCCNVFRMRGDLISHYLIYMDITPVLA